MKTIGAALKAGIVDNGTVATCVKITRQDGVIKGFTNHDISLTVDGVDYVSLPALEQIVLKARNNIEISNQEFTAAFVVNLEQEDLVNGVYDDADFDMYYVDWTTPSNGGVLIFSGTLGNIIWNKDGFQCDIYGVLKRTEKRIGTFVTQKCRHVLYSQIADSLDKAGSCNVTEASYTYTGSVSSITTSGLQFNTSALGVASDHLKNGILTWTSGNNNGATFEVKTNTASSIDLFLPTSYAIQNGDTFSVTAGCDKVHTTCHSKFNNIVNFGGFPFSGDQ